MFTVYVLRSQSTSKIYIGQTGNLNKRLLEHNNPEFGKRSYTKLNGRNWILVYKEEYQIRRDAIRREKELKSFRGREYLRNTIYGPVAQR